MRGDERVRARVHFTAPITLSQSVASRHFDNTSLPQVQRQDPDLSSESHCAHQMRLGNGGAGRADIFISWALVSTMFDLLEAIELYVKEHGLDPSKTMFWICNFSIRQTEGAGKKADVERLGLVVEACMLMHTAEDQDRDEDDHSAHSVTNNLPIVLKISGGAMEDSHCVDGVVCTPRSESELTLFVHRCLHGLSCMLAMI